MSEPSEYENIQTNGEEYSDFDLGPNALANPMRLRAVMARREIAPVQGPIDFGDSEMQHSVTRFLRQLWMACLDSEAQVEDEMEYVAASIRRQADAG